MITIYDYGAGNLQSVQNTLGAIGAQYTLVRDAAGLRSAAKIILPGVGHFGQMMRALDAAGVRETLVERIRAGVPYLGICLGMQALFERSEEAPEVTGMGVFEGSVLRFAADMTVPHMGWNALEPVGAPRLLDGLPPVSHVYFAHSYYVPESKLAAALCEYGHRYTAAIEHSNIYGVQFHPEKSGPIGLRVVRNFVELA
jgi:imidazole glycerol-phosphate synthase subunit HisH